MKLEAYAEFKADFPHDDDEVDGEFVQTPGRGAAEAIAQMLMALGYAVEAPEDGGEHGWTFSIRHEGQFRRFEVAMIDDYIFQSIETGAALSLFKKPKFISAELLPRLAAEMARDPRFGEGLWFTKKDFLSGSGGVAAPIVEKA
jgi:hypothetical protein